MKTFVPPQLPPKELVRNAVTNICQELSRHGTTLIEMGAIAEAGFMLACERWFTCQERDFYYADKPIPREEQNFEADDKADAPAVPAPKCRHEYGAEGKCAKCGAVRSRKPRTAQQPLPGGTP